MTRSMAGAPGAANSSQLLLRKPSVAMPASRSTCSASGLGRWFSRGLLPAENAWKRPCPMWFRSASARMLRAELCVQRNRTFMRSRATLAPFGLRLARIAVEQGDVAERVELLPRDALRVEQPVL